MTKRTEPWPRNLHRFFAKPQPAKQCCLINKGQNKLPFEYFAGAASAEEFPQGNLPTLAIFTATHSSGSNLTFKSWKGFPSGSLHASLAHANRHFHFSLKPVDRRRLSTVVRDRNAPHKHVWRGRAS